MPEATKEEARPTSDLESKSESKPPSSIVLTSEDLVIKYDVPSNPSWMKKIADGTQLGSVSMPGTHDTMTFKRSSVGCDVMKGFTTCQTWDLSQQLHAGIRFLDIRLRQTTCCDAARTCAYASACSARNF